MYKFKIVKMMEPHPVYSDDCVDAVGYTEVGDMAIITHSKDDYYETVIVSGKYIGVDTLALNDTDLERCVFVN